MLDSNSVMVSFMCQSHERQGETEGLSSHIKRSLGKITKCKCGFQR